MLEIFQRSRLSHGQTNRTALYRSHNINRTKTYTGNSCLMRAEQNQANGHLDRSKHKENNRCAIRRIWHTSVYLCVIYLLWIRTL